MNFLALTWGEITGIVGAVATIFTVFIVPFSKWLKKKKIEKENKKQEEEMERKKQEARDAKLEQLCEDVAKINVKVDSNSIMLQDYIADYDSFSTQNLKYMINDAYFGYNDIHEIPDDVLTNACECCEIYVNKKHKNHEIKPRCRLLWEEQERRAVTREEHHE